MVPAHNEDSFAGAELEKYMIEFSVLASSSKANSTVIKTPESIILLDCGLSARKTVQRLAEHNISPDQLTAIFITHEHRDHSNGLATLTKRFGTPVYCNKATSHHIEHLSKSVFFESGESFVLGDLLVTAIPVLHDAVDPVSFHFEFNGWKLAHITDLGQVTEGVIHACKEVHAVVIESNYDTEMLATCDYHWQLKERISSSHGHLSNKEAALLINAINHRGLKHIVLAHLSQNSNCPDAAQRCFYEYCSLFPDQQLHIGSEYESTAMLALDTCAQQQFLFSAA